MDTVYWGIGIFVVWIFVCLGIARFVDVTCLRSSRGVSVHGFKVVEMQSHVAFEFIDDRKVVRFFHRVFRVSKITNAFTKRTGKKVQRVNRILIHPEHEHMIANIDRRVVGENAILECKTTGAWNAKEWEGDDIPPEYVIQVMHYLAVTGAEKAYFAVLIGGNRFAWKEIARDEELIAMMVERERAFWDCVETETPPPLSESKAELHGDIMNRLYPSANEGQSIELPPTYSDVIEQLVDVKTRIKELEVSQDYLENQVKEIMKEAERARVGRFSISWKNVTTKRFDTKLFEKTNPDLYSQYVKESQSRRFTVKEETA